MQAKILSHQTLNPIAYYSTPHFFAYRDAQAQVSQAIP